MIGAGTHGAPSWVDLSTRDLASATTFYAELLGWTVARTDSPMGVYAIGMVDGFEVAGMMESTGDEAGAPPMWTVFFTVDDVDATARAATDAGGALLASPLDLPDARIAVVADPAGAMFGIISGPEITAAYLDRGPGSVRWVELLTRHPEDVVGFYTAVFGWRADTLDVDGADYTMFRLVDDEAAGMMRMPDNVPDDAPSYWAVYFAVDDCAATADRAAELGGQVLLPPTRAAEGRFAVLEDPLGAVFCVLARAA